MTVRSLSLCGPDPLNRVLRASLGVCGQVPVIILRIATASRKTCLPSMPCSDGSSQPVQTRAEGWYGGTAVFFTADGVYVWKKGRFCAERRTDSFLQVSALRSVEEPGILGILELQVFVQARITITVSSLTLKSYCIISTWSILYQSTFNKLFIFYYYLMSGFKESCTCTKTDTRITWTKSQTWSEHLHAEQVGMWKVFVCDVWPLSNTTHLCESEPLIKRAVCGTLRAHHTCLL